MKNSVGCVMGQLSISIAQALLMAEMEETTRIKRRDFIQLQLIFRLLLMNKATDNPPKATIMEITKAERVIKLSTKR